MTLATKNPLHSVCIRGRAKVSIGGVFVSGPDMTLRRVYPYAEGVG